MKKILALLGIAILVLAAVAVVRASTLESRQVTAALVTDLSIDTNGAALRLAGAIALSSPMTWAWSSSSIMCQSMSFFGPSK